ncbi:MAG: RHS repeat-associated core domain-containing protein [Cytophagales bacterium]|nr:RHS repeat-associated core domain-containing protein [Cytophagales bacterium]
MTTWHPGAAEVLPPPEVSYWADYYPFGQVMASGPAAIRTRPRFGYQGEWAEDQTHKTGWVAFEARMYDPVIGRWISMDPARQTFSSYLGMGNNPIMYVDPDGRLFGKWRAQHYANKNGGIAGQGPDGTWGVWKDSPLADGGVHTMEMKNFGHQGFGPSDIATMDLTFTLASSWIDKTQWLTTLGEASNFLTKVSKATPYVGAFISGFSTYSDIEGNGLNFTTGMKAAASTTLSAAGIATAIYTSPVWLTPTLIATSVSYGIADYSGALDVGLGDIEQSIKQNMMDIHNVIQRGMTDTRNGLSNGWRP